MSVSNAGVTASVPATLAIGEGRRCASSSPATNIPTKIAAGTTPPTTARKRRNRIKGVAQTSTRATTSSDASATAANAAVAEPSLRRSSRERSFTIPRTMPHRRGADSAPAPLHDTSGRPHLRDLPRARRLTRRALRDPPHARRPERVGPARRDEHMGHRDPSTLTRETESAVPLGVSFILAIPPVSRGSTAGEVS